MQIHFNQETENLKTNLIKMASLVDQQVESAINALSQGDIELCREIKAKDLEIDAYDNLLKTQCENILALFQPVASDLRFVMSALMINNQLERCGDIAVNISQRVKKTVEFKELIAQSQILEMGKQAQEMVKKTINSFINDDIKLANEVIESDEIVDRFNKEIFRFLVEQMKNNQALIEPCSHLMILTRHVERLADHATNIAEDILFHLEARIISHRKKLARPADEK